MKTTLLAILFLMAYKTSSVLRVFLAVSPSRTQFWEYETFSVRCEHVDSDGWMVWRYITSGWEPVLSPCGSGWGIQTSSSTCRIETAKLSDSGVYWCESARRGYSETIYITIARSGSVILHSPPTLAAAGNDVPLLCDVESPSSSRATIFYKEGAIIRKELTNHMIIHNFSKSDEGIYKCVIRDHGESPSTRLLLLDDDPDLVWLEVWPTSSQLLEYDNVSLSCGENSSDHGWNVFRAIRTPLSGGQFSLQRCGPKWGVLTTDGCILQTAKKPDNGLYWCETPTRERSNMVNFTVYDTPVVLQSPVSPVKTGDNIMLHCRIKGPHPNHPAAFYKDGYFIRTEPTRNMTISNVSESDEGVYKCEIIGLGESPPSWLFVRDANSTITSKTSSNLYVLRVLFHLVVICPYCISTILMVSLYLHRPAAGAKLLSTPCDDDNERMDRQHHDAVDVITEHHF